MGGALLKWSWKGGLNLQVHASNGYDTISSDCRLVWWRSPIHNLNVSSERHPVPFLFHRPAYTTQCDSAGPLGMSPPVEVADGSGHSICAFCHRCVSYHATPSASSCSERRYATTTCVGRRALNALQPYDGRDYSSSFKTAHFTLPNFKNWSSRLSGFYHL